MEVYLAIRWCRRLQRAVAGVRGRHYPAGTKAASWARERRDPVLAAIILILTHFWWVLIARIKVHQIVGSM